MLARLRFVVFSLALAVAGLAAQGFAYQSSQPSPEAKQHYGQARKLFSLGEKEKAIEELKAAIKAAPLFVEAHRDFLDNQRDKAASFIEEYEGYSKANPDNAVYRYVLGKAYSNAGMRDKADAEFEKALELDPQFGWAMLAVSTIATRAGDTARTIELWEKGTQVAGDNVLLRTIFANNFNGRKMYERALKEAERVLQIDPNHFEAHRTKWQARMNLTFGSEETRAEVLRDIQALESKHGKEIPALLVAQDGYQILENEEGAQRVKEAILAIDATYFERQPYSYAMGFMWADMVRLSGPSARRFSETFSMKDEKQKIEAFKSLENEIEDPKARTYILYTYMLRSYAALKDADNAERVMNILAKSDMDARTLAGHRVTFAKAMLESKAGLNAALDHTRAAIEAFRQPPPQRQGSDEQANEYAREAAKKELAGALHLHGQILLEKGMVKESVSSLDESVKLLVQEESLFDLGNAYAKLGRKDYAIDALARAYAFEGARKAEAKSSLEKIYDSKAKSKPIDRFLADTVESHRAEMRKVAIKKALAEIARTEAKDAPEFTLATLSGQKVQLTDLRGKVLLLNFWATW